jgi:hypothetical protein
VHEYWQSVINRQFAAAIQMVQAAVEACPDGLWDDRSHGTPFWHLAYHTLFYADFYFSPNPESFQAREFHSHNANFLPGDYAQYAGVVSTPENALTKTQLLDYAAHCLRKCDETLPRLTAEAALQRCGFPWYNLNTGEFLLNSLRHTQHHAGQLALLLRRHASVGVDWLGTRDNQPPPPTWE